MNAVRRVAPLLFTLTLLAPIPAVAEPALHAPPQNLIPTSASLREVLALHRRAAGSPLAPVQSRVVDEQIASGALSGKLTQVSLGADAATTETLGGFTTRFGVRSGMQWRQDENGVTVLLKGVHQQHAVTEAAIERALQNPAKPGPDAHLLGESTSPSPAYVVEVHPPDGDDARLFIDASSGLLVRREDATTQGRRIEIYDQFHVVNGVAEPWHGVISTGTPGCDLTWEITSDQVNAEVSAAEVAVPPNGRKLVEFPTSASDVVMPARIIDGHVIVRATIAGRGYDFMLDTGSSAITLDSAVIARLQGAALSHSALTAEGVKTTTQATIPEMDIGDLRMHDVVVTSLPFGYRPEEGTLVVGIIGFDFFANAVVHIDYDHGTAEAMDPASFRLPSGPHEVLGATLDDGVPYVNARVGGFLGRFIFDTGADIVVLFSRLIHAHPAATADQGRGAALLKSLPPVDASIGTHSVGGFVPLWPVEIGSIDFGGVDFTDSLVYRTRTAGRFEGADVDGLIGQEFLRYFDIYVDYRNARIILAPNASIASTQ